jgi:hypothetical protein
MYPPCFAMGLKNNQGFYKTVTLKRTVITNSAHGWLQHMHECQSSNRSVILRIPYWKIQLKSKSRPPLDWHQKICHRSARESCKALINSWSRDAQGATEVT